METINTTAAVAPEQEDAFLASLRIDQSYSGDVISVKKPLLTVPARKPTKTEFFRVHPEHMLDCYAVELKTEREIYIVKPGIESVLAEFVEPVRLRLCVTRQGVVFVWPLKLPKDDARRGDTWNRSAVEAASLAVDSWVRVSADMSLGAYQPYRAAAELGDPRCRKRPGPRSCRLLSVIA
jgi:hypothetical protein